MHVKTYTGSSTSAVLATIKAELGNDAIILDTRQIRENGKKKVVVTAAQERHLPHMAEASAASSPAHGDILGTAYAGNGGIGWKSWQEEWTDIKGHILSLIKPELHFAKLTPRQRVALEFLERQGVDHTSLLTVYDELAPDPEASILAPLAKLVSVKSWNTANWPQRVHMLAGPFGVGKTTALVRMALLLRQSDPQIPLWIVNADSERGGGRLLLQNYANLCGLVYKEAADALSFAAIQAEARTLGVAKILVDLPGLPRGKALVDVLEHMGMTDPDNALHLVVSPHYATGELRGIFARYLANRCGGNNASIVWTKLDEAEKFGTLVNVGAASRTPVSTFSCGPELSGTLVPAESAALWRLLFKQEMPVQTLRS